MRRNLFLLFSAVFLSLIAGEAVVRMLGIAPKLIFLNVNNVKSGYKSSPNPILGYELKANYRDPHPSLHFGSFPQTNSLGQRDIERTYAKPPGIKRILLLGDSIVAGHGIWDLNDTISRQLERSLGAGSEVEVLNMGVGGYQTLAESELLKTKGVAYSPDLVILVFEDNDFEDQNDDLLLSDPQVSRLTRALVKHSALFRLAAVKTDLFGLKFRIDPAYRMHSHRGLVRGSVEKGIARIKALSAEHGFGLLVVIWPRFSDRDSPVRGIEDLYPNAGQIENLSRIEEICRKNGVDAYPLAPFFIEDYNTALAMAPAKATHLSLNKKYTIGDTCHPNEYGAGVAAKALRHILLERNFFADTH